LRFFLCVWLASRCQLEMNAFVENMCIFIDFL